MSYSKRLSDSLKSGSFWLIVATFVIAGIGSITSLVPPTAASILTVIGTFLSGLVHSLEK